MELVRCTLTILNTSVVQFGVQSFSKTVLYLLTRTESPTLNFTGSVIFIALYTVAKSLSTEVTSTGLMTMVRCFRAM